MTELSARLHRPTLRRPGMDELSRAIPATVSMTRATYNTGPPRQSRRGPCTCLHAWLPGVSGRGHAQLRSQKTSFRKLRRAEHGGNADTTPQKRTGTSRECLTLMFRNLPVDLHHGPDEIDKDVLAASFPFQPSVVRIGLF